MTGYNCLPEGIYILRIRMYAYLSWPDHLAHKYVYYPVYNTPS